MKIILSGASGLVGSHLIDQLSKNDEVHEILSMVRRKSSSILPKVKELEVNFHSLSELKLEENYDIAFCALGTTLKKAGSMENQIIIDKNFVVNFASFCKNQGAKKIGIVSSLGSDSKSKNFYLRTKGEMENEVINVNMKHSVFVRPSILIGKRNEFRFGEKIGVFFMKLFGFLFIGSLRKYKGVHSKNVAKTLIEKTIHSTDKVSFIESNEIL